MIMFEKVDLKELDKLENLLIEKGIQYIRDDFEDPIFSYERHGIIITDPNGKWICDAVCSSGTYGYENGLLEFWSKKLKEAEAEDPIGWLTAEEAFENIEAAI